jgi:class 3 adenylate cyclase/pimeloyl-ACP methyl ester carboxylesterase
MNRPEVRFTRASDGAYLAYQMFGEGPIDLFWQEDTFAFVDELWDSPPERAWHEGMAEFARMIIYDRRGLGLSSRDVAPGNLETQVTDTLAVLDAEGIGRAYFGGVLESGAPNMLLAATYPERVRGLVWMQPVPRSAEAPDFPWGVGPEYAEREQEILEWWGTRRWAESFVELNAEWMGGVWSTDAYMEFLTRVSRRTCTPDVAGALARIWFDTDVRNVLATIKTPVLLMVDDDEQSRELLGYLTTQMPQAEVSFSSLTGDVGLEDFATAHEAIRRFVGAERAPLGLDSVLATVLFTDIVGSTRQAAAVGDRAWRIIQDRHDRIVRNELERYRGREIKRMGDGFLATFDGPARGVRCAQAIIEEMQGLEIEVRAGLHTGEIQLDADDIAGLTVAIAARVGALAGPSEVLISQTVKDLIAGSGLTFVDRGEHDLKGVPDRWRLYRAED